MSLFLFKNMTKTYAQIKEADEIVGELYRISPELKNSKFAYAWKKFADKNYRPLLQELNNHLEDARIENCLVDPITKEILHNDRGGYKFDRAGMATTLEVHRKLLKEFDEKEIDVTPFYVKAEDLPVLTEAQTDSLKGLVIE